MYPEEGTLGPDIRARKLSLNEGTYAIKIDWKTDKVVYKGAPFLKSNDFQYADCFAFMEASTEETGSRNASPPPLLLRTIYIQVDN